ncbi:B-like cyclin [Naegleria gruberi]|uniref:B-like cyclin n=1 Tax=Naegleria gruberi TaxID=5762 RepID=D2W3Y0_NAEGR|nr:B-like cyclin [Naegleria gruberi]EFC36215.1 B-like cyclin [Naegleria gruberi]|eukprot:XP_002668959.1 B-like cyclin [Naegleria gruberi]
MTDENAFVPSVHPATSNKMMLSNPNIKPTSKPYLSSTTNTINNTTQRTCLGDISNQVHHLPKASSLPFKAKPLTNNLNNSKENIKLHMVPKLTNNNTTTTTTTTTTATTTTLIQQPQSTTNTFVPTCIPPHNTHSLITPSSLSSFNSTTSINTTTSINLITPQHNITLKEAQSPPPKKASLLISSPKIDEKDCYDPQHCTEYIKDIVNHYKSIEKKYLPDSNYMGRQQDLQPQMRAILIDWLIDVHCKFLLVPETLYLTINLVDRFLSEKAVSRQRLQLLGITAMFIASKYEEISSPIVADFVKITKDAYTRDEVLRMERIMLQVLDFNLTVASSNVFLKRYLKCGRCTELQTFIAIYLSELSLMDYAQLEFTPSTIACAAVYLSKHLTQDLEQWDLVLQHYTEKSEEDILPCARVMLKYLKKISSQRRDAHTKPLVAAVNKYKKEDKLSASRVCAKMVDSVQI